jgi:hypothetical protein
MQFFWQREEAGHLFPLPSSFFLLNYVRGKATFLLTGVRPMEIQVVALDISLTVKPVIVQQIEF